MLDLLVQVAPMQSASRSASVRYRGQRQVSPRRHACRVAPKAGARVRPAFPSALQPAAQPDRASLEAPAQTVAAQPLLSDARRSRRASGSAVCGLGASELRAPPSLRIDLTCSINYDVVFSKLGRYNDLFAALSSMIYLPAFFAAFPSSTTDLQVS